MVTSRSALTRATFKQLPPIAVRLNSTSSAAFVFAFALSEPLLGVLKGLKLCSYRLWQRVVHRGRSVGPHHCAETLNPLWLVTLHEDQQARFIEVPQKCSKSYFSAKLGGLIERV
jgi:hypothetical protein